MIDDNLSEIYRSQNQKEKQWDVGTSKLSYGKSPLVTVCKTLFENGIQIQSDIF